MKISLVGCTYRPRASPTDTCRPGHPTKKPGRALRPDRVSMRACAYFLPPFPTVAVFAAVAVSVAFTLSATKFTTTR